jgi:hypothetical protein
MCSRGGPPRATLFFPPAVLLTTLTFTTVMARAKSWGRIRGGRTPGSNGDKLRRGSQSVSSHPINRT